MTAYNLDVNFELDIAASNFFRQLSYGGYCYIGTPVTKCLRQIFKCCVRSAIVTGIRRSHNSELISESVHQPSASRSPPSSPYRCGKAAVLQFTCLLVQYGPTLQRCQRFRADSTSSDRRWLRRRLTARRWHRNGAGAERPPANCEGDGRCAARRLLQDPEKFETQICPPSQACTSTPSASGWGVLQPRPGPVASYTACAAISGCSKHHIICSNIASHQHGYCTSSISTSSAGGAINGTGYVSHSQQCKLAF